MPSAAKKPRAERLYYQAGVYLIRSKRTGAAYVGASCFLERRMETHLSAILNETFYSDRMEQAFKGHKQEELEFRVLEFVQVESDPKCYRLCLDRLSRPGRENLLDRERYWIIRLNPSVNCNKKRGRIVLSEIPVGPGEEAMRLVGEQKEMTA